MSLTPEQLREGLALAEVSASPVDEHPKPVQEPEVIPEPIGANDTHRMTFDTPLERQMYEAHQSKAIRRQGRKFRCYGGLELGYER